MHCWWIFDFETDYTCNCCLIVKRYVLRAHFIHIQCVNLLGNLADTLLGGELSAPKQCLNQCDVISIAKERSPRL
jgi:hypothetical protein